MKKPGIKESRIDEINAMLWNRRFDDSLSVARDATINLDTAEKAKYPKGIAYANLNIAAATFLQSKNDIALKYLTDSMHWLSKNTNEKGYARALLLKGNIFESFGDYEKTLMLWLDASKVSKAINDVEGEGEAYSQLGLIYSRLCNFNKALEFFNKGLKIREELKDENAAASSLNRIGMVLRQTKKYNESLDYYNRSLEIRKKNKQHSAIPWTLLGIANTYEEMKMYPQSLDFYERGQVNADKRCALQCLIGSGRVNSLLGNGAEAESKLLESLKMAMELKSYVLIAEANGALAAHYELFKEHSKALKYFKLQLKSKEAFHSTEIQNKLSNIEVAHAIEISEQEKEIYRLRHVELKQAYDIIEEKNKDILASINYASRIQRAMLPGLKEIRGLSSRCFILYLPKDIVSGDFYWFTKAGDKLIIVAGDCTGHGVPGALMSMLGISFLEEIVNRRKITGSSEILNELRIEVQRALHQRGISDGSKDGMDIALCVIDNKSNYVEYSGAYNNLWLVRDNELLEYRADRMPIGIYEHANNKFTRHEIQSLPGDIIYMYSDGYPDQFGGKDNKKYKYRELKDFIMKIHKLPFSKQKEKLEKEYFRWKGNNPQTDDVVVIGLKL